MIILSTLNEEPPIPSIYICILVKTCTELFCVELDCMGFLQVKHRQLLSPGWTLYDCMWSNTDSSLTLSYLLLLIWPQSPAQAKKKDARGQSTASLFETETTDQVGPSLNVSISPSGPVRASFAAGSSHTRNQIYDCGTWLDDMLWM